MAVSPFRVLGGIAAGIIVMAALWAIAWESPRLAVGLILGGCGTGWGWFVFRSLRSGGVHVRGERYLRAKSPIAYWSWLAFYVSVGAYVLGGGTYALLTS